MQTKIVAFAGGANVEFTETTLIDDKPPTPPGNIHANGLSDGSVELTWTDYSDNATGFVIQRSNDGKKTWTPVGALDAHTNRLFIPPTPGNIFGLSEYTVIATSPYIDGKEAVDKEIADYSVAIRLDPKDVYAYNNRGTAYEKKGEFGRAIQDFRALAQLEDYSPRGYNEVAWIYATCPKEDIRDGAKAVDFAKKACEISKWGDGGGVDTLAAAEAEAGQFDEAVKHEQQAIKLTKADNASADTKAMEDRVALYRQRKPFRETPK